MQKDYFPQKVQTGKKLAEAWAQDRVGRWQKRITGKPAAFWLLSFILLSLVAFKFHSLFHWDLGIGLKLQSKRCWRQTVIFQLPRKTIILIWPAIPASPPTVEIHWVQRASCAEDTSLYVNMLCSDSPSPPTHFISYWFINHLPIL